VVTRSSKVNDGVLYPQES